MSLADLLAVRRVPDGSWDSRNSAWAFPATDRHASLLKSTLRALHTTEQFDSLIPGAPLLNVGTPCVQGESAGGVDLGEATSLADAPGPEPAIALPDGLLTQPWRHQVQAYSFCLDKFAAGLNGLLLAMGMGCIDGDAILTINRRGAGRRITLRELYRKFHGGESNGRRWQNCPTRTRSMIGGELRLNEVLDVIAQGVKPVVQVTLASGKSLRVTSDHEFATSTESWIQADKLVNGDVVLTNGIPACKSCGGTVRVTTYRYAKHVGICRSCIGKFRTVRGKFIDRDGYVRLSGMQGHPRANARGQVYEHIVVMEQVLGRRITPTEHVHHKNHIKHDNRPENLEVLPAVEHHRHHGACGGYLHLDAASVHFVPKLDTVVSVEPAGETDVYDIRMAGPGHNFVANGIVVHNCGKTLVAIMLILHLKARRVMIVSPLRVVPVWLQQIERHCGIDVITVALDEDVGSVAKKQELAAEKLKLAETLRRPFICVINYDSVWRDPFATWAEKIPWDLIVSDEAHRIKAPGGKTSLAFKRLRAHSKYRIALTGTPMPHGPMDIYAIFRFLDVRIYGPSFSAFRQKYAVMGGYQRKQIIDFQRLDELEQLMSRITFRVGKEVLDLPPETHVTYRCDLTVEAARIYGDLEEDFVARVLDGTVTAANAMVKLLRLQQVTGGVVPTDDGIVRRVDNSKQKLLADTLEDIGKDEPVVVFCRFHADLDAVHEACKHNGFSSLELSGRRDELKRWQDGEAQVLAVQISAGGVGVDLTRARYSLFYSLSFSLGEYDQALSRVHRPGQTKPVEHIHLVARNTVDTKILRALEKRAEVVNAILAEIRS
jgi:hypothetical protein